MRLLRFMAQQVHQRCQLALWMQGGTKEWEAVTYVILQTLTYTSSGLPCKRIPNSFCAILCVVKTLGFAETRIKSQLKQPTTHVILSKLLNVSKPQFFLLENEDTNNLWSIMCLVQQLQIFLQKVGELTRSHKAWLGLVATCMKQGIQPSQEAPALLPRLIG